MMTRVVGLLLLAVLHVVSGEWVVGSEEGVLVRATDTYDYSVSVGGVPWLKNGYVALQCDGVRYSSGSSSEMGVTPLTLVEGPRSYSSSDSRLGSFEAYNATWRAGGCTQFTTEIRYYFSCSCPEFTLAMGEMGAFNTNTMPASGRQGDKSRPMPATTATEFPAFDLPDATGLGLGFVNWNGDSLSGADYGMLMMERPGKVDMSKSYVGGLVAGPLILYNDSSSPNVRPFALTMGASASFQVARLMKVGTHLVGGAQGMITTLPPYYELRFLLLGGGGGVTGTMTAWGAAVQKASDTHKMSLANDVLSRQLHYLTDNGGCYCYCLGNNLWWPACTKTPQGCTPMSVTLEELKAYHHAIQLPVGVYHLDPWWYSHQSNGGCQHAPLAMNYTPSPFHFPRGLGVLDLSMQLFFGTVDDTDNVYMPQYFFNGQAVVGEEAKAFYREIFGYHVSQSNMKAIVWDNVDNVWLASDAHVTDVHAYEMWHAGLADTALEYNIAIRVDQNSPAQILSSVLYGAHTVGRCTHDADPGTMTGQYMNVAGNALFLASVGVRPMCDVLWTMSVQPGNVYRNGTRPDVEHDIIVATLSAGPVGIGDQINSTNVTLINFALRKDGTILKPARSSMRLDRFYSSLQSPTPYEIHIAPSAPAASTSPDVDKRADSRAELLADGELWWWNVLATNVNGSNPQASRPVELMELWPAPPAGVAYLVHDWHSAPCQHGTPASRCLHVWNTTTPLDVLTSGKGDRVFKLRRAAPVLPSGWALVGEIGKFVAVSPQRFVLTGSPTLHRAPTASELGSSAYELEFLVLGSSGEIVDVTVVTSSGTALVVHVEVSAGGQRTVQCGGDSCEVV